MADDDDAPGGSKPGDERKRPTGRRKPQLGNPDADPQRIHREYVERHLGGGREPTPEAYERAAMQWRRIPGSISRPPAELRTAEGDRDGDIGEAADETTEGGGS